MKVPPKLQQTLGCAAMVSFMFFPAFAQESVAELQAKFDRENNSVKKARLLVKLADAQFEESRRAGKAGDDNVVDATMEKFREDRKSTRLNSSHRCISYAVFCLKKKK